jgi:hypothetical protein
MRVTHVTVTRPKPGRLNDAIGMGVEAGKLLTRHGAEECRLFIGGPAGEATGTHVFIAEFTSWEAYGAFADEIEKDHELEVLMDRLTREDSPLVFESQGLSTELALDRKGNAGRGRIVEAYISKVVPGQFEAAMQLASDVFDYVEARGAVNAGLAMQTLAGSMTDTLIASWELESNRALGKLGDSYMTEPEGQAIMARLTGADAPITTIASGIYTEVPI